MLPDPIAGADTVSRKVGRQVGQGSDPTVRPWGRSADVAEPVVDAAVAEDAAEGDGGGLAHELPDRR